MPTQPPPPPAIPRPEAIPISTRLLLHQAPSRPSSSTELRRLVLDYLCHSCFLDTAVAFAREQPESGPSGETRDDRGPASGRENGAKGAAGKDDGVERTVHFEGDDDDSMDLDDEEDELETVPVRGFSNGHNGVANGDDGDVDEGYPDLSGREIRTTRLRSAIKEHILNGRIKEAIDILETHFPTVMGPAPSATTSVATLSSAPSTSGSRSLHRSSSRSRVPFTTRPLSGPTHPPHHKPSAHSRPPGDPRYPHTVSASLEPTHIAFNLQIQAFIEFIRTTTAMPAATTPPPPAAGVASPATSPTSPKGYAADLSNSTGNLSEGASPASLSSSTTSVASAKTSALTLSLTHCQALWRHAGSLPDPSERAIWMKELEGVSALLGYHDPGDSPVKGYLKLERRMWLAERVNAAILVHTGRTANPLLQMVAQQTIFTWDTLHGIEAKLPSVLKGQAKVCPQFNLTDFIREAESGSVDP